MIVTWFKKQPLHELLTLLIFFSLPIDQSISTILIVLTSFLTIIEYRKFDVDRMISNCSLPVFFISYIVIASLFRDGFQFKHIEYRLSLFVIPLIINRYKRVEIERFIKWFILGLLCYYFICLIRAFYNSMDFSSFIFSYKVHSNDYGFFENGIRGGNYFLGEYFVGHLQSSYYAMYCSLGVVLLHNVLKYNNKIKFIASTFLVIAILQSQSKVGFLMIIIVMGYLVIKYFKRQALFLLPILFMGIFIFFYTNKRVLVLSQNIYENGFVIKNTSSSGNQLRMMTWESAIIAIKEKSIVGYGIDAGKEKLFSIYAENDYRFPLKYKLNTHNTYLQILLEGGVILLLIFLWVQFFPLYKHGLREELVMFLFLCLLAFSFESYFSRYIGISFFALFYSTFLNLYDEKL